MNSVCLSGQGSASCCSPTLNSQQVLFYTELFPNSKQHPPPPLCIVLSGCFVYNIRYVCVSRTVWPAFHVGHSALPCSAPALALPTPTLEAAKETWLSAQLCPLHPDAGGVSRCWGSVCLKFSVYSSAQSPRVLNLYCLDHNPSNYRCLARLRV